MNTTNPRQPVRLAVSAALLALASSLVGGCGSSSRSDFYNSRGVVAKPVAGTGQPLSQEMAAMLVSDEATFAAATSAPQTTQRFTDR